MTDIIYKINRCGTPGPERGSRDKVRTLLLNRFTVERHNKTTRLQIFEQLMRRCNSAEIQNTISAFFRVNSRGYALRGIIARFEEGIVVPAAAVFL